MEVVILADAKEIGAVAADAIGALLGRRPDAVLGLATGSSPLAIYDELAARCDAGLISFHDTVMYTTLSPCSMCAGAIGLFKLSLLVIGESETFPGSKDILSKFNIPFIDLSDERSINMMKNWRSNPANERVWQGDIGN